MAADSYIIMAEAKAIHGGKKFPFTSRRTSGNETRLIPRRGLWGQMPLLLPTSLAYAVWLQIHVLRSYLASSVEALCIYTCTCMYGPRAGAGMWLV